MTPTEQKLNDWLAANGQSAIKTLAEQGMTLRFVHGPENYHQDRPSLMVEAEGVGFSFQQNFCQGMGRAEMLDNAVAKAPAMREAFDRAREKYQSNGIPLQGGSVEGIIQGNHHHGDGWDICNHQTTCSTYVRDLQEQRVNDFYRPTAAWDVTEQVKLLCDKQQFFDNLKKPEFVVALSRHADTVRPPEGHLAHLTFHEGVLGVRFNYVEGASEPAIRATMLHRHEFLCSPSAVLDGGQGEACGSTKGVSFEENSYGPAVTATITAKDLDMDPAVMDTFVVMGMEPVDILTFEYQKTASASSDFLDSLDMDMFSHNEQGMDHGI